jgi:hexosaminidase
MSIVLSVAAYGAARPLSIVPAPAHVERKEGSLDISRGLSIDAGQDKDAASVALYLEEMNRRSNSVAMRKMGPSNQRKSTPTVMFTHRASRAAGLVDESYGLEIGPTGVRISANERAGYFYGAVTLLQLLSDHPKSLPALGIEDAPRFRWRGFMLDSARHLQTEAFIFQLLDYMAEHKLNVFHWHLTDDQAWRIEIKRYPKLTSVGAFRGQTMPPYEAGSRAPTGAYGGFFTQEQIKKIVAYAKARNITVVPEIEMPGHSSAALAAYPEFGSAAEPLGAPPIGWGIFPNLYNVNDATFEFLQSVLLEIMDLFPSEYIHVGGDEAIKDQWKSNTAVQARMRALGIESEDRMQSWFMGRIEKFLNDHGRKMVGWDEILEGGLAPNATVMSWRGTKGGIAAAQQGHDTIFTPSRPLYFNYRQSDATDEPPGRDPLNTLADVYSFEAVSSSLTTAERGHVLGVEACLWTEYVITQDRVEHMLFPRIAALAEVAWTRSENRSFHDFLARLPRDMRRTDALGLHPANSVFEVRTNPLLEGAGDRATLELSTQGGLGEIHYTLDGSKVNSDFRVYKTPLQISVPSVLRAQAFDGDTALGAPIVEKLTLDSILRRDSRELDSCTGAAGIQLEQDPPRNAERPIFRVTFQHPCWIYRDADLDRISGLMVGVGSIPYIFHGPNLIHTETDSSMVKDASLEVRVDSCQGESLTAIPLAPASRKDGVTTLSVDQLAVVHGKHDLCFSMKNPDSQTVWLLNFIQPLAKKESVRTP